MNSNNMMNGMFDHSKLMDRFFRKVDDVVWDLMSGRIGIATPDGIVTLESSGEDDDLTHDISVNMTEQFGMAVPAFAQNTPIDQVKVGDLIRGSRELTGWVIGISGKTFSIITINGTISQWQAPKVKMMGVEGVNGVMVVRSLMNMLPGGNSSLQGMQGMLMPMMMMSGGDIDLESIMPMMLMGQMGNSAVGTDGTSNPMGDMNSMMPMMMMMSMMKGGGSKPSVSLFGNSPKSTNNFFDREKN